MPTSWTQRDMKDPWMPGLEPMELTLLFMHLLPHLGRLLAVELVARYAPEQHVKRAFVSENG